MKEVPAVWALAFLTACVPASPTVRAPNTDRSSASASAERQFSRFLSEAIGTRKLHRVYVDSLYTDGDIHEGGDVAPCLGGDEERYVWLADFHVLSVRTHGDSTDAAAAITIAATEVPAPDGESFTATPLIEEDTAYWTMVRAPVTGWKWMVCGPGVIRRQLFGPMPVGRTINWPHGGSREAVANVIDSIRRARKLPLAK